MSLTPYSVSASPLGTSIYRFASVDAPAQYVPELVHTTVQNKTGTNINNVIRISAPITAVVDGVTTSANKFIAEFKFTALRSVKEDTMRIRVLDEMIAYLTANRNNIANGSSRPVA